MGRVYRTLKIKKEIIKEAYQNPKNVKATARKYQIKAVLIRRWKAKIAAEEAAMALRPDAAATLTRLDISKMQARKTHHKGSGGTLGEATKRHLLSFHENLRQHGRVVTVRSLAIELLRFEPALAEIDFILLINRIRRFCVHHKIVQRRVTHAAQNHIYNIDIMIDWVNYVNREIVVSKYTADCIVNIDQTNIDFDVASPTTLQSAGSRTVSVKITGSSDRCTVILGVTLSGRKLPALVIFKGQPNGRIVREFRNPTFGYPQDMFYAVQPKAWDDAVTHVQWINQVWLPYCRQQNQATYLILDEFKVHLMGKIVRSTQQLGTQVEFIPGGYTGALQALDKGVNKPFKDHYRKQQLNWQIVNEHNARPKRHDVAQWIRQAWEDVTPASITNTWRSIGINAWEPAA
jgi:transposase-like protein